MRVKGSGLKFIYTKFSNFIFLALSALLLSSCSGLSDGVVQQIENIPLLIEKQSALIASKKRAFDNLKSHKEWSFFSPYLNKEKWSESFIKATKSLSHAEKIYKDEIVPVYDRDEPDEDTRARVLIKNFEYHMKLSLQAALYPEQRLAFLVNARDTAAGIHEKAFREVKGVIKLQKSLTKRAAQTAKKYSNKKQDITAKVLKLDQMAEKAKASMKNVSRQYSKNKTAIDYAVFADEAVSLSKTLEEATVYHKNMNGKFDELYRSYTKVLADQRIEYFVVIGRSTWCSGEYCGNGTSQLYPRILVDEKTFNYFDSTTVEPLATMSLVGWEKHRVRIPKPYWNALRLDKTWNWPRGDDHAEYWVNNTFTRSYHRYIEVENDVQKKTDWVEVKEDDFWHQYNNLGMAILTKPYGYYEEDSLKDAQPVGMATIAKPVMQNNVATGSNQYGEWRQENGRSFWHYYGMYRMFGDLTGRNRYYYNDYYGYQSHSWGSPYYGRQNEYGTWGSSTYNNRHYRNSDYAIRNPSDVKAARSGRSQRSSRVSSSVRGAGAGSRGRGPGNRGK